MRNFKGLLPAGEFDLTVSNPPYFPEKQPAWRRKKAVSWRFARSEETCTLL